MTTVRIEVTGGVAELTEKPDGVAVVIVDYDNATDTTLASVETYPEAGAIDHADCGCQTDGSYVAAEGA